MTKTSISIPSTAVRSKKILKENYDSDSSTSSSPPPLTDDRHILIRSSKPADGANGLLPRYKSGDDNFRGTLSPEGFHSNMKPGEALAAAVLASSRSKRSQGLHRALAARALGRSYPNSTSLSLPGSKCRLSVSKNSVDDIDMGSEVGTEPQNTSTAVVTGVEILESTYSVEDNGIEECFVVPDVDEPVSSSPAEISNTRQNAEDLKVAESEDDDYLSGDELESVDDVYRSSGDELESEKKALPQPNHASTGLHREKGGAAEAMLEGSRMVLRGDAHNSITTSISSGDYGMANVLAVHANYIAVGMASGVIIVAPSNYSTHNADFMDAKMLVLGLRGDRSYAAGVTSICFNQQGDLVLAGYEDGQITIWDVLKSTALKVITGQHKAPVVHAFFLSEDSLGTRQFKAVTGDSNGHLLLHDSSVVPLLNLLSIKTKCLLDGETTGTVLSASPLLFAGCEPSLVEAGVVILATHQTALVVRLGPFQVYAQLSRPEGVREGSMPYTAWKHTTQLHDSPTEPSERVVSLLAIAWDRKVQVAKLNKSELTVYGGCSLDSAAIGVAWLDNNMLVILTVTGKLCLCANNGAVIHETSIGAEDLVSHHTYFSNVSEKAYHNCLAVRGVSAYILGPARLTVFRVLPWKERIQILQKEGDMMGALNMALTIYDGKARGVFDLPRSLEDVQKTVKPFLVELTLAYVEEAISYISLIQQMDEMDLSMRKITSLKEEYARAGRVVVELCLHINATDVLFYKIYSKFIAVKQKDTFLELLEPYVLRDMIRSLPREHYNVNGWFQRLEQCVLHTDISSLDFNQVVRLSREKELYDALIYLLSKRSNDATAPLLELLPVLRSTQKPALGYKILVYLKNCFSGLASPLGTFHPQNLPSTREKPLHFLLEKSSSVNSRENVNLHLLLEFDTEATLDVLRCAFADHESSSHNLVLRKTVDALILFLDKNTSQKEAGFIFDFIVQYVARRMVTVSKEVLYQILEYLFADCEISKGREKQVLALLEVVPETHWDASSLLSLCEKAHFYQVCGLIHKIRHQYLAALDSYLRDVDQHVHVFSFINTALLELNGNEIVTFRSHVINRIPELVVLNRNATLFLVMDQFIREASHILTKLQAHPKSLFLYLKTVIEFRKSDCLIKDGSEKSEETEANLKKMLNLSELRSNGTVHMTDDIVELYLELLCQYEPDSVFGFLKTCDSYRVEHCLRLCRERGIIDAATFLFEKVGDVSNALLLLLSSLNDKLAAVERHRITKNLDEVKDIEKLLGDCIGLCKRNSPSLNPQESEILWFNLLDSFCEPLMGSSGDGKGQRSTNNKEEPVIKWRITRSHKSARILKKLFSRFIKEIVEAMIGYVRQPTIVSKLLSDNGTRELGAFKLTILGMLSRNGFETRTLSIAKSLVEDESYERMCLLKKGVSRGFAPRSQICELCGDLLTESARIFNCGHWSHLQCKAPLNASSSLCPICKPAEKPQTKSVVAETGLAH